MEATDIRTLYMANTLLALYKQWIATGRPMR